MPAVSKIDEYFSKRVLELLLMPFRNQVAFKLGLINEKGDVIRSPKNPEEKDALTSLHRVLFKIRQVIDSLPNGASRLKQAAVALQTIRRKPVPSMYLAGIEESYGLEFLKSYTFILENNLELIDEEVSVKSFIDLFEDGEGGSAPASAPTNTTAGVEPQHEPVIKPGQKTKIVKRKPLLEDKSTLYVSRPVSNVSEIAQWAKDQGFKTTLDDDMHVTICYSRNPVGELEPQTEELVLGNSSPEHRKVGLLGDDDVVVLHIESPELRQRWQEFRDAGASWDHDGYNPHITITYSPGDVDLDKVEPYLGRIILLGEVYESLDEDWKDGVEEK